jgi:hypothetical protein
MRFCYRMVPLTSGSLSGASASRGAAFLYPEGWASGACRGLHLGRARFRYCSRWVATLAGEEASPAA